MSSKREESQPQAYRGSRHPFVVIEDNRERQFQYQRVALDAHDAPMDVVMEKSPAWLEMLGAAFKISGFCNLLRTQIIFMNDSRAQL